MLDNFEHVIEAAPLVSRLLEEAPELTVLVTSRELLRLSGERELQVPPLASEAEAIELFGERAAAAGYAHELTAAEVAVVAEICRRLDGVPLAIELAASRMRLLTPAQLLNRLSERLTLRGPRDAPVRQRTLEAAIAWSYELLSGPEQLLFGRLGAFHGSFSVDAAEEVAGPGIDVDFVEALSSLLDKSIVSRLPGPGETRFAMLRMIREYALERLREGGERESTLDRFEAYYLRLATEAEDGLRSASQRQWRRTLDLEADNWRAALTLAADRLRADQIAALMRGLWLWFWLHGNLDEAREWVGRGLACAHRIGDRDGGWLLGFHGAFAVLGGEPGPGTEKLVEAQALLSEARDVRGNATMKLVHSFGIAALKGEEFARAQLEENLATFEELDDLWGIGTTLHAMTRLRVIFDRYEGAGDLFERAVASVGRVGDEFGVALASHNLAMARLADGDVAGARAVIDSVLERRRVDGITFAADDALDVLARIEHAEGKDERAIALLAAADAVRQRTHIPLWPPALERHEPPLADLRGAVGDGVFEAAYARGATVDLGEVDEIPVRLAGGV